MFTEQKEDEYFMMRMDVKPHEIRKHHTLVSDGAAGSITMQAT